MKKHDMEVIMDSVTDGVFTVNGDWRITSFNRAAEEITGVGRNEAIGQRCCEVFRASICEGACALKHTLATGKPVINKVIYILDSAGSKIPISISTAILRDGNGNIIGGVETFRDLRLGEELRRELESAYTFANIVGRSVAMRRIFDIMPQLSDSDSTVLIEGASGTGKELFAQAIHSLSPRSGKRFVAINCAALPDSLLESELFGHKAGAFTDARQDRQGRFAAADGGTIFLDEIGDVSPAMQSRLLRVLQEKTFEPLGSNTPVAANVRVIAATNKDLSKLVRKGMFREDLFYRINVIRMELPTLRDRREDIPLLIEYFIAKFNRIQGKHLAGLDDDVMAILMSHDYPGNVRELENIMEHAFVLCREGLIRIQHLPPEFHDKAKSAIIRGGATLETMERLMITDALRRHGGNRRAASQELGINPSTLFRKAQALGIELPEKDGRSNQ